MATVLIMPPSKDTTVTIGVEGTDIRITIFVESRRVKTASLTNVLEVKTGEPRDIGHAVEVKVTDELNPHHTTQQRAIPDYTITADGQIIRAE